MKPFMSLILTVLAGLSVACSPAHTPAEQEHSESQPASENIEQIRDKNAEEHRQESHYRNDYKVDDCQLTMGFDIWEPYQFMDVGDQVRGLDVEIAQALANKMNCELHFTQATWVDLLRYLQEGDVDMLMGASRTSEREQYAFFSEPYREEQFVVFVRSEEQRHFNGMSLEELLDSEYRLGIVDSYYYGDDFQRLYEQEREQMDDPRFVSAMMSEFNLVRLLDRDIDGFIEDPVVGHSLIRRKGLGEYIGVSDIKLSSSEVYIMLSRENLDDDMLESVNNALEAIQSSGEHDAIMERYSH